MKRGFTIIELLTVIGIIAVLMTIVTTASMSAIRSSRSRRTDAMRVALQASIATYQASDPAGKWPGALNSLAESAESGWLNDEAAQNVFRIIVQRSTGESGALIPLIDPNGLFVAPSGSVEGRATGLSFAEARQGNPHRQKLAVARMLFGWQGTHSGKFHCYNIYYNAQTDSAKVSTCCKECQNANNGSCRDSSCRHCHEN